VNRKGIVNTSVYLSRVAHVTCRRCHGLLNALSQRLQGSDFITIIKILAVVSSEFPSPQFNIGGV
jgi:hypothetical protein